MKQWGTTVEIVYMSKFKPPEIVSFKLTEVIFWCGSGEDGKSRADQLQHLLKNLDQYVSSPVEYQRQRACHTVVALLKQFQALCTTGSCPFNCIGNCMHLRSTTERGQSSSAGTSEYTMFSLHYIWGGSVHCGFYTLSWVLLQSSIIH